MKKIIVHIDLNTFFVQCEVLQNPQLKGKPVAVGHDGPRGVISTSSYEARKLGVFSGMPVASAKNKCKDLILVPCNFSLYSHYSKEFFRFLKNRYPILEQASVDECYIDMTKEADRNHLYEYLFDLQMELYRVTNLKCSIGCSFNRFLAKMGSDYKKPLGITIFTPENFREKIYPLSIEKMYGIGKKTAPKLRKLNIESIGDLARCVDPEVKRVLGSMFDYLKDECNGIANDIVDPQTYDPKSISSERTFLHDNNNYDDILQMIHNCVDDVVASLEKYQLECLSVGVKIRTPDFVTKSRRLTLREPSCQKDDIYLSAVKAFEELYHGQPLRLIGVSLERVQERRRMHKEKEKEKFLNEINSQLDYGGNIFFLKDKEKES
jgi:hypothetical protein